jgi:hypothetical protein
LEEDLVAALRSLSNVFDGVVGAGDYWETIQDATEMAESDHPEARTFFDSRPWCCGLDRQRTTGTAANPRLKNRRPSGDLRKVQIFIKWRFQ